MLLLHLTYKVFRVTARWKLNSSFPHIGPCFAPYEKCTNCYLDVAFIYTSIPKELDLDFVFTSVLKLLQMILL